MSSDPIKESLADAGFADIRIDVIPRTKAVTDAAAFARGLVHGSPIIRKIQSRGADPGQVIAALADALRRALTDTGPMPLQAMLFEATRST